MIIVFIELTNVRCTQIAGGKLSAFRIGVGALCQIAADGTMTVKKHELRERKVEGAERQI